MLNRKSDASPRRWIPIAPKPQLSYQQLYLLLQMKELFGIPNSVNVRGFCVGMSITWACAMRENKEQEYYDLVKTLVEETNVSALRNKLENNGKLILAYRIAFGQFPHLFTKREDLQHEKLGELISYIDSLYEYNVDSNLLKSKKDPLAIVYDMEKKSYNKRALESLIIAMTPDENNTLFVTSRNEKAHVVVIFRRNGGYHLYDNNYDTGIARFYPKHILPVRQSYITIGIVEEIFSRLFAQFGLPIQDENELMVQKVKLPFDKVHNELCVQAGTKRKHVATPHNLFSMPTIKYAKAEVVASEVDSACKPRK